MSTVTCAEFDEGADELALGLLDEPERTRLLEHAATCARCRSLLDDLVGLGDRLLLATPLLDPPAGFEARTLERMGGAGAAMSAPAAEESAAGVAAGSPPRRRRLVRAVVAAVTLVAAVAAGIGVGRAVTADNGGIATEADGVTGHGVIVSSAGAEVGTVTLVLAPEPHVLVAIDTPRRASGTRTCQLRTADGSWVTVGTWTYDEIATGIWAVGIDRELLTSDAMQVVDDNGAVLATASLG